MKISQVLVLPPYQRRGIASRMYEAVFNHYRLKEPKCFEVLVEDAADEFQKVQDVVNSKVLVEALKQKGKQIPGKIQTSEEILQLQLSVEDAKQLSQ